MRIGIDARFFGPDSKGLGRYTQMLITHLEKIDQNNDYVIFLRRTNFDTYVPHNVRFTKILADYRWYSFAEQLFFPFVLYRSNCDLVHFPHFNVPILYCKKFVVTIHDLILLRYPTRKASTRSALFYWIKFFVYKIVIAYAVARAQTIIAVSLFTKNDVCRQYPRVCNKVRVVYEAAEIETHQLSLDDEMMKKCGIIGSYMLYVGNAYPHKNLSFLVDAFALYKKNGGVVKNLVLVGKDDHFYAQLERYIRTQNITGVLICHTVDDVMLQELYKNAHLFVFPSLYEGFGLPPLEAQSYGVPVLSSTHPCMQEILSHDGAVYADAKNCAKFADAMMCAASDNMLRHAVTVQGYHNVQKYSWQKMANNIYEIYQKNR